MKFEASTLEVLDGEAVLRELFGARIAEAIETAVGVEEGAEAEAEVVAGGVVVTDLGVDDGGGAVGRQDGARLDGDPDAVAKGEAVGGAELPPTDDGAGGVLRRRLDGNANLDFGAGRDEGGEGDGIGGAELDTGGEGEAVAGAPGRAAGVAQAPGLDE